MKRLFSKEIKRSERGITFSDERIEAVTPKGSKYKILIDKVENELVIVPSKSGLKVSIKKTAKGAKPLYDIG